MSDRYDADAAKLLPCIAGITCDEAPRDPKCWTCSRRSAVAAALRALGEWREAIIDAAVVNWTYKQEHEVNPRAAVNDLLAWQSKIALDPRVSLRAKELHDKIRTLGEENERLKPIEDQLGTCFATIDFLQRDQLAAVTRERDELVKALEAKDRFWQDRAEAAERERDQALRNGTDVAIRLFNVTRERDEAKTTQGDIYEDYLQMRKYAEAAERERDEAHEKLRRADALIQSQEVRNNQLAGRMRAAEARVAALESGSAHENQTIAELEDHIENLEAAIAKVPHLCNDADYIHWIGEHPDKPKFRKSCIELGGRCAFDAHLGCRSPPP